MRLLHLTPELPCWPGGTGGATRQFHLLRQLVQLGHEVTVVAPVPARAEGQREHLRGARIRLTGPTRPDSRARETLAAVARDPALLARVAAMPVLAWQVSVFWTALRPVALAEIAKHRPDAISIEHDSAAHWIDDLPPDIPTAMTVHNVGRHYYESRARAATGARKAGLSIEARRFARHDRRHLRRFDALIAVSDRDADDLRSSHELPITVIPNGVASDNLQALPPSGEPDTLLFTGTLSHPPNSEGIVWFADAVWPRIRAQRPTASLLVVGRGAARSVLALNDRDGIEVIGAVPDMAPYFARATAVVVPLLSGGGTRLKILEAFASRRAVVSTPTGREGLAVDDGRDLLVAASAEDFATATLQLLDDAEIRDRLAGSGRALAERSYDWRVLGERLERRLIRLVDGARGQSRGQSRTPTASSERRPSK